MPVTPQTSIPPKIRPHDQVLDLVCCTRDTVVETGQRWADVVPVTMPVVPVKMPGAKKLIDESLEVIVEIFHTQRDLIKGVLHAVLGPAGGGGPAGWDCEGTTESTRDVRRGSKTEGHLCDALLDVGSSRGNPVTPFDIHP